MRKTTYLFIFLCCFFPFTGYSKSFLRIDDSFSLAKAVKLGRSSVKSNNLLSSYNTGKNELPQKECDPNCLSCDTTTGQCFLCESDRYLNDNLCLVCPEKADCNGKTFTCNSGYAENDRHDGCVISCPENSYYSETETMPGSESHCIACGYKYGPCSKCNAQKCSVCTSGYTADLALCPEGYTLVKVTNSNCGMCVEKSCPAGYTAGKEDCTNEELTQYDYDYSSSGTDGKGRICGKCVEKSCPEGYTRVYTSENTCNPPSSYSRADQGPNIKCMKCNGPTCGTYPNCCSGQWYGPAGNSCITCDPNASVCSKNTITCKTGYILKGGYACVACHSSCETCSDVTWEGYCTSCPTGKRLYDSATGNTPAYDGIGFCR